GSRVHGASRATDGRGQRRHPRHAARRLAGGARPTRGGAPLKTSRDSGVRIGLVGGGDPRRLEELDALDSLWVGRHVASRNPSPEAMMGLARLAASTERVEIGTSILLLPLYPPALVAKQI